MSINVGFTVPKDPGTYIRTDNSAAKGTGKTIGKALILGQRLSAGTKAKDLLTFIPSKAAARGYFGVGSMLAREIEAYMDAYDQGEVYAIAQDEPSAGVAATGTILCAASTSLTGILVVRIGGQYVFCAVTAGDAANTIATNLAAAINAIDSLPVTATTNTATITLTVKWKGITGNKILVEVNPLGPEAGQVLPGGVTLTVTAIGGVIAGSGAPDLDNSLAAIVDKYDVIVCPYADAVSLDDIETKKAADWGPTVMKYGHVATAYDDTYANLITFSGAVLQNDPHTSLAPQPGKNMPRPMWERAAIFGAKTMKHQVDAGPGELAQGFSGIEMTGDIPCAKADEFTPTERNILLGYGISSGYISGGKVYINRARTTYMTDETGETDTSYYDQRTLFILQYLNRADKAAWEAKFRGAAIPEDGESVAGGIKIVTPTIARGFFAGQYTKHRKNALVRNIDTFLENLQIEEDDDEPSQMNIIYPPNITAWLATSAWSNQFRIGG